jgi:hypothetical protein
MLHQFSSKFELEQSQLELIKEYLSAGEAAMLDQTRTPILSLDNLEPISDNEDEDCQQDMSDNNPDNDSEDESGDKISPTQVAAQDKQARRKRPRRKTSEAQDDEEDGLPLPEMPTEESTQARSGRIRKKPRLPDGFEIDKL